MNNREKFWEIISELNSSDFLEPRDSVRDMAYKKYDVKNSDLYFEISYTEFRGRIEISFLCKKPILWEMTFEQFLDKMPDEVRGWVLFNLDIFKWGNPRGN